MNYLSQHRGPSYNGTELADLPKGFELPWQTEKDILEDWSRRRENLRKVMEEIVAYFGKPE